MSNNLISERRAARDSHFRWRSAAVALAAASMLLIGCGSDTPEKPAATSEAPAASPLEGTWRTGSISPPDAEAALRQQGFGKFVKDFRANSPFATDTVLELSIEGGQWNLYGETDEGREPIDYDAEYTIDGDTVTFEHADGSNTHRWTVDGDTLSLEWVKGTLPPYEGVPDEVIQRALYMTEKFTRQG